MAIKNYLESLSAEHFIIVSAYMVRDRFGLIQPNVSGGCVPACSGAGSTKNGYWVCSGGECIWIPAA